MFKYLTAFYGIAMIKPEDIPDFLPIRLQDKGIFDQYFKQTPPEISEYTFTNLFMWRHYYGFRWIQIDGQLIIIALKNPEFITVFPPIGTNPRQALIYLDQLHNEKKIPLQFERFPQNSLDILLPIYPKVQVMEDRDNFDYVYSTASLRDLPGGDLFNERKKLNKFKKTYKWEYQPLSAQNLAACIKLQAEWCGIRNCEDDPALSFENNAIQEILQFWTELKFTGGIITIDGRIQAYTLGEPLNPQTMVVHVEKANAEFNGLYQAINQQYAEITSKDYEFINREQDLGLPSLRRAKENYHPIKMIKKFKGIQ